MFFYKIKQFIRKSTPKSFINFYHFGLAFLASFFYRFPSRKMVIIGITGTNGKTTTANILASILEDNGYKIGMTTTINFKIGDKVWENKTKQGMQGRFKMQKLLFFMKKAACDVAIIETTSQGIGQFRSFGIKYDTCIFTNITPEHIEAHGGFENYKKMKLKLFKQLENRGKKFIKGKYIPKTIVANFNDSCVLDFVNFKVDKIYGNMVFDSTNKIDISNFISDEKYSFVLADNLNLDIKTSFDLIYRKNSLFSETSKVKLNLFGVYNIYSAISAVSVAVSLGINIDSISKSLEKISNIPGRMEFIPNSKNIIAVIDYAHDPISIERVYKGLKNITLKNNSKLICVLGSCGGGRDKNTRYQKGQVAGKLCDYVFVTNEDSYDDDPKEIINDIFSGVCDSSSKIENIDCFKIESRKEAIFKASEIAKSGDIIITTGKGSEKCIVCKNGTKMDWNEFEVLKSAIESKK
jgi:UDP-N-acetylmuramoyl-L-alanyl-D-glutamate--2,6-diaminopimelate ligase